MRDERQKRAREKLKQLGYNEFDEMDDPGFSMWYSNRGAGSVVILVEYRQGGFEIFGVISKNASIEATFSALETYTEQFVPRTL